MLRSIQNLLEIIIWNKTYTSKYRPKAYYPLQLQHYFSQQGIFDHATIYTWHYFDR